MLEKTVNTKQESLSKIPSVDDLLKSPFGEKWLASFQRRIVLKAIRLILETKRKNILKGFSEEVSINALAPDIEQKMYELAAYKLRPLINATGVVIHTNLGRSILSDRALRNITNIAGSYSNLEYEISQGKRGTRY